MRVCTRSSKTQARGIRYFVDLNVIVLVLHRYLFRRSMSQLEGLLCLREVEDVQIGASRQRAMYVYVMLTRNPMGCFYKHKSSWLVLFERRTLDLWEDTVP